MLFLNAGCSNTEVNKSNQDQSKPKREHAVLSVLWQQNSAEYRALCYQAFNIAGEKIKNLKNDGEKRLALITDIDETVLDNSPYNAMQIKRDLDFDKEDWIEWGSRKSADALPGAVDFFNMADSLGVEVFYISNRYHVQLDETLENLNSLNFPKADTNHVFLKTDSSEKQERRNRVLENYEVVLYLGDNLSDFSSVFDNQSTESRNQSVDNLSSSFGEKFIVFPNPMYGDWESRGIYESNRDWTDEERDSIRHAKVYSYE